jgi:hypothetical protein
LIPPPPPSDMEIQDWNIEGITHDARAKKISNNN